MERRRDWKRKAGKVLSFSHACSSVAPRIQAFAEWISPRLFKVFACKDDTTLAAPASLSQAYQTIASGSSLVLDARGTEQYNTIQYYSCTVLYCAVTCQSIIFLAAKPLKIAGLWANFTPVRGLHAALLQQARRPNIITATTVPPAGSKEGITHSKKVKKRSRDAPAERMR